MPARSNDALRARAVRSAGRRWRGALTALALGGATLVGMTPGSAAPAPSSAAVLLAGGFANVTKTGAVVGSWIGAYLVDGTESTGRAATASRFATGRYRVHLPGVDTTVFAFATAYDNTGSGRTCKAWSAAGNDVVVRCFTPTGADVDSGFAVVAGHNEVDAARVYRDATGRWVSRRAPRVVRLSAGTFDVDLDLTMDYDTHFYGERREFGAAAFGAGPTSCAATKRTQLVPLGERFRYRVVCHNLSGTPTDADFVLFNYYTPQNMIGLALLAKGSDTTGFWTASLGGGRFRFTSRTATYTSLTSPALNILLTTPAGVRCAKASEAIVARRLVVDATCRRAGSTAVVTTAPRIWLTVAQRWRS